MLRTRLELSDIETFAGGWDDTCRFDLHTFATQASDAFENVLACAVVFKIFDFAVEILPNIFIPAISGSVAPPPLSPSRGDWRRCIGTVVGRHLNRWFALFN